MKPVCDLSSIPSQAITQANFEQKTKASSKHGSHTKYSTTLCQLLSDHCFPPVGMIFSNTVLFLELLHYFSDMCHTEYSNESGLLHIFVTSVNFQHVLFSSVYSSNENKTRRNFNEQKILQMKISQSTVLLSYVSTLSGVSCFTFVILEKFTSPSGSYVCTPISSE